mmetsp:Transcript_54420/g.124071  ORF Transcript_54420/g.124071 Transcript_54420/m.124071 type:complete len:242 (-) Transcript_54420:315-1040(-)
MLESRYWQVLPAGGLPPVVGSLPRALADHAFECGLTWTPHHGRSLVGQLEKAGAELAGGGLSWALVDPKRSATPGRLRSIAAKYGTAYSERYAMGLSKLRRQDRACGYADGKAELEGTKADGWVRFKIATPEDPGESPAVGATSAKGRHRLAHSLAALGFCASFSPPMSQDLGGGGLLVHLDGEPVQAAMGHWMGSKTLGVEIECFGLEVTRPTRHTEEVTVAFRVVQEDLTVRLSHLLWR